MNSFYAIGIIIFASIVLTALLLNPQSNTSSKSISTLTLDHQKEISEDDFNTYLKDNNTAAMQNFLDKRYADLVEIQKAWMNFDYNTLRRKTADELYNDYSMQLDTLKEKGQKNIMEEFDYDDAMVTKVTKENDNITVTVEIITNFYDYIINSDGKTVRGNENKKVRLHYQLTFVKSLEKPIIDKCPACVPC